MWTPSVSLNRFSVLHVTAAGPAYFLWDTVFYSTLIGLGALALLCLLPHRPATRSWLAVVALVLMLLVPVWTTGARESGLGLLVESTRAPVARETNALRNQALAAVPSEHVMASSWMKSAAAPAQTVERRRPRGINLVTKSLLVVWGLVSATLLYRLLSSGMALRSLRNRAVPCDDQKLLAAAERAADQHGLVSCPPVMSSRLVATPAVSAFPTPWLLVPPESARSVDASDWYAIFCHELAHLRRRDPWTRMLVELVRVVIPWQPLIWKLRAAHIQAADEACDDWAVAYGTPAVDVASILARWIPSEGTTLGLRMATSLAATRRRIDRLLERNHYPRHRVAWGWNLFLWALFVAVPTLSGLAQPRPPQPHDTAQDSDSPGRDNKPLARSSQSADVKIPRYVIGPTDVLHITTVKMVPQSPYHLARLDITQIIVDGTIPEQPIAGSYQVDHEGTVSLGPAYGRVKVAGLTVSAAEQAIRDHLREILQDPSVSLQILQPAGQQQITGKHRVAPDGTVTLGIYGPVEVAGKTIEQARRAIEDQLSHFAQEPLVSVDVDSHQSKAFYIVLMKDGEADSVRRIPITGNERVLDVVSMVKDLTGLGRRPITISRTAVQAGKRQIERLPVKISEIMRGISDETNYAIRAGDRIIIGEPRNPTASK